MKRLTILFLLVLQACIQPQQSELDTTVINSGNISKSSSETSSTGTLQVRITDAPFPYDLIERADVEIHKVEIRGKKGFQTISEDYRSFNLIELRAGLSDFLTEVDLPVGRYDLIRLHVTSASVTLIDGEVFHMKVPSGPQTGIKVFLTPKLEITANSENTLTLDFDLAKSFVLRGNMEKVKKCKDVKGFNFKPVIRATYERNKGGLQGYIYTDNGTIDTTDDMELPNAHITLIQDNEEIATTSTVDDGRYQFNGIDPGTYDMVIEYDDHQTTIIEDVEVVLGEIQPIDDVTVFMDLPEEETEDDSSTGDDTGSTGDDSTTGDDTGSTGDDPTTGDDTGSQDPVQEEPPVDEGLLVFEGVIYSDNGTSDKSDDQPVNGAYILVKDSNGTVIDSTTTDGDGYFNMTLPEGNIEVTIQDPSHTTDVTWLEFYTDLYVEPILNTLP